MILTHNNYKAILPTRYWDKFLQLKESPKSLGNHVVYTPNGKVSYSHKKQSKPHEKQLLN